MQRRCWAHESCRRWENTLKSPSTAILYGALQRYMYIIIRDIISAAVVLQQVYRTVTSRRDLNRRPCTRYITKTFDFDISRSFVRSFVRSLAASTCTAPNGRPALIHQIRFLASFHGRARSLAHRHSPEFFPFLSLNLNFSPPASRRDRPCRALGISL
jgi:hypothetical protein